MCDVDVKNELNQGDSNLWLSVREPKAHHAEQPKIPHTVFLKCDLQNTIWSMSVTQNNSVISTTYKQVVNYLM